MKIGLLTVYFADFGSYYQAAAMQKYLESKGHTCELINDDRRAIRSPRLALGKIGTKVFPAWIKKRIANRFDVYKNYLSLRADVDKLSISPSALNIKALTKRYDCVIVGSDELWSATNKNMRFVPEYYGINVSCPIISYSTSGISMNNPSKAMMNTIQAGLKSFKSISVRDRITAGWVGKLLNREIEVVLDPTLLNPYFKGKRISTPPYALVYGEHFSDRQVSAITEFAKRNQLLLYAVAWKHPWCDKNIDLDSASQLQDYFMNCSYSFTSTFHGTIFSIVNQANFTSFSTEQRGEKIKCLLEQLDLSERLFNEKGLIHDAPIDYIALETRIKTLRESSERYLENALKTVQNEVNYAL